MFRFQRSKVRIIKRVKCHDPLYNTNSNDHSEILLFVDCSVDILQVVVQCFTWLTRTLGRLGWIHIVSYSWFTRHHKREHSYKKEEKVNLYTADFSLGSYMDCKVMSPFIVPVETVRLSRPTNITSKNPAAAKKMRRARLLLFVQWIQRDDPIAKL